MHFAFSDDQLALRDAVRDLLDEGVHARGTCAPRGRTTPAACPRLWDAARRDGRGRHARARRRPAGSGSRSSTSCSCSRRPAASRCPNRSSRPRRSRRRRSLGDDAPTLDRSRAASCTRSLRGVGRHRRRRSSRSARRSSSASRRTRSRCTPSRRSTAPAACSRSHGHRRRRSTGTRGARRAFDRGVLRNRRAAMRVGRPHARDDRRLRDASAGSSACRSARSRP